MRQLILALLLMMNIAYANSERYYIKLGSFKNLKGLERSINHLPKSLRSHVVIVRANSWYVPFAFYVKYKRTLYAYLPKFKRYFPDAHINHSSVMLHHPVVRNYSKIKQYIQHYNRARTPPIVYRPTRIPYYQNVAISEEDNTLHRPIQSFSTEVSPPRTAPRVLNHVFEEEKKSKNFSKKMLSGKHYYLAYKSTKSSPDLLIKVSFGNHMVVYQPVIGDMKMTEANYLVENRRLYMFANTFTKNGAYSILDKHRKNHFLVSSWVNGKKLNTLRYYSELNDAKEYLGLETSKGLANILEEGGYDEFFLEENN